MVTIDVVFPDPKGQPVTVAAVLTPTVIARDLERINWNFVSCDSRIEMAEIEFNDQAHTFFNVANHPSQKTHQIKNKFYSTGHGAIYGDVPPLGQKRPVPAKYTVRGLDASGKKCSEVDPEIVVNEP